MRLGFAPVLALVLALAPAPAQAGERSLRFYGNGYGDVDRVKTNVNRIYGNILLDRDRYGQDRKFGLSIAGGRVVFGVSGDGAGDRTICGDSDVLDGAWHHVAVQRRRSDGKLWLYVDGRLEARADGPDGDVSYPDDGGYHLDEGRGKLVGDELGLSPGRRKVGGDPRGPRWSRVSPFPA